MDWMVLYNNGFSYILLNLLVFLFYLFGPKIPVSNNLDLELNSVLQINRKCFFPPWFLCTPIVPGTQLLCELMEDCVLFCSECFCEFFIFLEKPFTSVVFENLHTPYTLCWSALVGVTFMGRFLGMGIAPNCLIIVI